MPRVRIPAYRHYKPKDLGLVVLGGRQIYLGRYNSPESLAEYRRLVQEWLARGVAPEPPAPASSLTVDELVLAFWTGFAERHYRRPDGTPTGELGNYRDSLRSLRRLYGHTPAADFGPSALKAVRQAMIDAELARTTINQRIGRVVRVFKWGVENELVPPAVHQALRSVPGLKPGRTAAREPEPVGPVDDAVVEAIRPHVSRQVWAMVELQRLTGMRPGEVTTMRTCDVDTSREPWRYTPATHKTTHRGKARVVLLGPRAQGVLSRWLRSAEPAAYLFSPSEAVAERRAAMRAARKTPVPPSQRVRSKRAPRRAAGSRYTTRSYHHAVLRGCGHAGVAPWHPHRLRHSAATAIRREFDLATARAVLGHSSLATAAIYAEADLRKAAEAIAKVG